MKLEKAILCVWLDCFRGNGPSAQELDLHALFCQIRVYENEQIVRQIFRRL